MPVLAHSLLALVVLSAVPSSGTLRARERSFFGLIRVYDQAGVRRMLHGTIIHGSQRVDPPSPVPGTYYHPSSPMARLVASRKPGAKIAVVGLGAGSLAASAPEDSDVVFFEIDPTVETIAREWFTYLRDSPGRVSVVLGDARLTLADAPDDAFDVLIVDAFSSDAIPVHLLTVEALELYAEKTKGPIALHISNRFLVLEPVVGAAARELALSATQIFHEPDAAALADYAYPSNVVVLAEDVDDLPRAGEPLLEAFSEPWTDDRSSLLPVLSWRW